MKEGGSENLTVNTEIEETFELLNDGYKTTKLTERRDAVLLFGITGSGKSTLTLFLTGANLTSVKQGSTFLVQDPNDKISTQSTIISKTLFPDLAIEPKTNTTFYDLPGFQDTRSASHDIAITFFIKKVADHLKSVKLVLVVNHSSFIPGNDRNYFKLLLRHATDLITDIDKFKDSFALIATKVNNPRSYEECEDEDNCPGILLSDNRIISDIADFVKRTKADLQRLVTSPEEKVINEKSIKIIDALLEVDSGNYTKIGIFRRPQKKGLLNDIPKLQEGKNHIIKIINENLKFTQKNEEDFRYTISDGSRNSVNNLIGKIYENVSNNIYQIVAKLTGHYDILSKNISNKIISLTAVEGPVNINADEAEIYSVEHIRKAHAVASNLVKGINNTKSIGSLARQIENSLATLGINTCQDNIAILLTQDDYFKFLQKLTDKPPTTRYWDSLFQTLATDLLAKEQNIRRDISDAEKHINNTVNDNLEGIAKAILEYYENKVNTLELYKASSELDKGYRTFDNMTKAARQLNDIQTLATIIKNYTIELGLQSSEIQRNIFSLANQGSELNSLQILSDGQLKTWFPTWLDVFNNTISYYLQESGKWYNFLDHLYDKLSEYEIQKDKDQYNVANLQDWGQKDKQAGIAINEVNLEEFLTKIEPFNVKGLDTVKTIQVTASKWNKLNDVLSLTLKSGVRTVCTSSNEDSKKNKLVITGDCIKFSELVDVNGKLFTNECKSKNNYPIDSVNIFALKTVFIDANLNGKGDKLKISIFAPKWEIIGNPTINIDGKDVYDFPGNATKARGGKYPGNKGDDGSPGLPGGPAGSFLGSGKEFINVQNLTITANGGNGGPGQHGGDGNQGEDGGQPHNPGGYDDPRNDDRYKYIGAHFTKYLHWSYEYEVHGTPASQGGNGGNGGIGGTGGNSGAIMLINLRDRTTLLRSENKNGNAGQGSAGGTGAIGGHAYYRTAYKKAVSLLLPLSAIYHAAGITWENISGTKPYDKRGETGINGTFGTNNAGMTIPESAAVQDNIYVITDYKSYLREGLNPEISRNYLRKEFILELLSYLDNNSEIKSFYNTLGLVNELQGLEDQYHKLQKNKKVYLNFYQSILDRIKEYAKKIKERKISVQNINEHRKVLIYLYTAGLTKVNLLKFDAAPNLIIDISGYFQLVEKNIKVLQNLQEKNAKATVIDSYKKGYKEELDGKIEEAKKFIDIHVTTEIDKIGIEIDEKIDSLIDEILALQQKENEKIKELGKTIALKTILSVLKVVGVVTSALGPMGAAVEAVIGTTTTISESLVLNSNPVESTSITTDLKILDSLIKNDKDSKVNILNQQLNEIARELEPHPILKYLHTQVENLQTEAQDLVNADWNDDFFDNFEIFEKTKLKNFRKEIEKLQNTGLNDTLLEEIEAINRQLPPAVDKEHIIKRRQTDAKTWITKAAAALAKVNQIAKMSGAVYGIYSKHKGDQAKNGAVSRAIEASENKIKKFQQLNSRIYTTLGPMLKSMMSFSKNIESQLGTKSQAALDVTKWQVQSALRDIKLSVQLFSEGFTVKDTFVLYIEKLEEAITTLINIYDRIQNYQVQQNLANYIADINSPVANSINITDRKLNKAISDLELIIRLNLILEQYKEAINAFKQWVFPCANHYLTELNIPEYLVQESNGNVPVTALISKAITEINKISSKLEELKTSIQTNDRYFINKIFDSTPATKPFFVWKNENYKSEIYKLLSGQEVVLYANVIDSPDSATKFNLIGIRLTSKNTTIQSEINDVLEYFSVNAIHLGNSYYKYGDKIYTITSPSQNISYSFAKGTDGTPLISNAVYNKMASGDLVLSPYAMWQLSLTISNRENGKAFQELEKYKDQVDLELIGHGSFVSGNPCAKVEEYYKADDTYNQVDWSQNLETEELQNLNGSKETYYSHLQDDRYEVEEIERFHQPLNQEESISGFSSYLKSPLIWLLLSLIATPLALWGMLASNRNRMRQKLRRGAVGITPVAILAIKPVEAQQSAVSLEQPADCGILSEKINIKKTALNKSKTGRDRLEAATCLPVDHRHRNNSTISHGLNSSQTEPNTHTTVPYSQMDMVENYTVFKWLCGFLGKRSIVANLNESERINRTETRHPLDEAADRLNRSIAIYGNKSFLSQKSDCLSSKNHVSPNNPSAFLSTPLAQSIDEMNWISSRKGAEKLVQIKLLK